MNSHSFRSPSSRAQLSKNILCFFFSFLLCMRLGSISIESSGLETSFFPQYHMERIQEDTLQSSDSEAGFFPQQSTEQVQENALQPLLPVDEQAHLLLNLPRSPVTPFLSLTNYTEDMAIREAILAKATQWRLQEQTALPYYRASNDFSISLDAANALPSLSESSVKEVPQPEGTLITARILLGLWASRHNDPHLSFNGSVMIHPDEILSWRGVQKHHRRAYSGSRKQFSDGYPWKQRQQVQQDLALLSRYQLRGQHVIRSGGNVQSVAIDTPYLLLTPIEKQGKIAGYLVAPGDWISSYEAHQMNFLASVPCQLFHLNPRNDYLAVRLAFYLTEYWRRHTHTGALHSSFCMASLLSASLIPIEKANLTSRFVPRVEAALQKLYKIHLLGEPPRNLSEIDRTKAHWGKDWLASSWQLVPAQE